MIAVNHGDFDRLFGELTSPDFALENRSRSAFPERSAAEFRASIEELDAMVASARTWNSAVAGCRRPGRRAATSAKQSGKTASSTHGRILHVTRSATGGSRRLRVRARGRGSGIRLRRGTGAGDRQPARGHEPREPDNRRRRRARAGQRRRRCSRLVCERVCVRRSATTHR